MRKYRNYTDGDIILGARQVESMAGLLRFLRLRPTGGNYDNMRRLLQKLNVDCSHWKGFAWSKDKQKKDWSQYTKVQSLKPHLIKLKDNTCEKCKSNTWLGQPIKLEVHHKDGNRTNNLLTNLQLLCPNCHSYTDFYRNRKN